MTKPLNIAIAAAIAFSTLAGTAFAQKAMNIGPGPGIGIGPVPGPTPVVDCPAGSVQQIAFDPYGNQTITCIYTQVRPINPVGAIIGGIVGGIIAGGHR